MYPWFLSICRVWKEVLNVAIPLVKLELVCFIKNDVYNKFSCAFRHYARILDTCISLNGYNNFLRQVTVTVIPLQMGKLGLWAGHRLACGRVAYG